MTALIEMKNIDWNKAFFKNKLYQRKELKNPVAENIAQQVAQCLPDNKALQNVIDKGEIDLSGIVRWEINAITERAWSIYLDKEHAKHFRQ